MKRSSKLRVTKVKVVSRITKFQGEKWLWIAVSDSIRWRVSMTYMMRKRMEKIHLNSGMELVTMRKMKIMMDRSEMEMMRRIKKNRMMTKRKANTNMIR